MLSDLWFSWTKKLVLLASKWIKYPAREPLLMAFMVSLQAILWHSVTEYGTHSRNDFVSTPLMDITYISLNEHYLLADRANNEG